MKIAFVSLMRVLPWGGSEELWFKTAMLALAKGHEVITLTQKWDITPEKIKELHKHGAKTTFYFKPCYTLADRVSIKLKMKRSLLEHIPNVAADVYVISNGTTWDFVQHQQLTDSVISKDKPYILISQHGYEQGSILSGLARAFAVRVLDKAAKIFFVAERNRKIAERQLAHPISRVQLISNPVNIKKKSIKRFPQGSKLLMACVARLDCDYKGQDILLQTLSTEQWRERDFQLNFYGAGPHLEHLLQLIKLYHLQEKVGVQGYVQDIDRIWETNQILVLPSLSEGTPLALVEAMLSGRAALTTDVGDSAAYVLDGKTGFLAAVASVNN